MTGKQIEAAKDYLYKKYYNGKPHIPENLTQPWSPEDEMLEEELSCREMINSILIYGGSCEEGGYKWEKYIKPFIEGDRWHNILIPKERVLQLIAEQKYDISKAEIGFAGEDCEGVSYNYCKWRDER